MKSPGFVAVLVVMMTLTGCGCAVKNPTPVVKQVEPLTWKIVRLSGRWSTATGCPVGPRKVLTAAHVVDVRPFDRGVPLLAMYFSQGAVVGTVTPVHSYSTRDLALVETDRDIAFYPVAASAPQAGETLLFTGYDWRDTKRAFTERMWEVKALRTVAGNLLIYEPSGEPGTSGSCVLNQAGEVVAINVGGKAVGKMWTGEVGVGVLVAGESF